MRVLLFAAALAACGTDHVTVPIVVPGQPVLFAMRDDGGPWQSVVGTVDGARTAYQLDVSGDFELALVCTHASLGFAAGELFGTVDDATISIGSWHVPDCTDAVAETGPMVSVTGTVLDNAFVAVGAHTAYVSAFDGFSLPTTPGVRDFALYGNYQLRVIHDQTIWNDFDEGTLGLAGATSPMLTKSFELALEGTETTAIAHTELVTRNGTVLDWDASPRQALFVPSEQLAGGDTQVFVLGTFGDLTSRTATMTNFDGVPPSTNLLPVLSPVALGQDTVSARWSPIDVIYTSASITYLGTYSAATSSQSATASKLWLDRHSTTTVAFDDDVPGYRPEWHIPPGHAQFTIERWTPGVVLDTTTTQGFLDAR